MFLKISICFFVFVVALYFIVEYFLARERKKIEKKRREKRLRKAIRDFKLSVKNGNGKLNEKEYVLEGTEDLDMQMVYDVYWNENRFLLN